MTSSLDRHAHDHDFLPAVAEHCESPDTDAHPEWGPRLRTIVERIPQPVTEDTAEPPVGAVVRTDDLVAVRARDGWRLISLTGGPIPSHPEDDSADWWPGLREHFVEVGAALVTFGAS